LEKSVNESQQQESTEKNCRRYPEVNVGEDACRAATHWFARAAAFHGTPGKKLVAGHYTPLTSREIGAHRLVAEGSDDREFPTMTFERSLQLALVP